jgi:hypothetical protein
MHLQFLDYKTMRYNSGSFLALFNWNSTYIVKTLEVG